MYKPASGTTFCAWMRATVAAVDAALKKGGKVISPLLAAKKRFGSNKIVCRRAKKTPEKHLRRRSLREGQSSGKFHKSLTNQALIT